MPDFTQMSRKKLKSYILQHPTDDDAITELFVNRRSPDAKIYPFPYDMSKQELDDIFRNAIQKDQ
ncbi:DUF6887 family protein [Aphanothece hegewaldii]